MARAPTRDPRSSHSDRARLFALPVDAWGVRPELFQCVVLPRLGVEHVDQHVAIVLHDPLAGAVALNPHPPVADAPEGVVDLLRQGVALAAAGTGADDEVVVQGMKAAHVKNDDVAGFMVAGRPGTQGGSLDRTGKSESRGENRRGSQETSSGPSDIGEVVRSRPSRRRSVCGVAVEHLPSGFRETVRPAPADMTGAPNSIIAPPGGNVKQQDRGSPDPHRLALRASVRSVRARTADQAGWFSVHRFSSPGPSLSSATRMPTCSKLAARDTHAEGNDRSGPAGPAPGGLFDRPGQRRVPVRLSEGRGPDDRARPARPTRRHPRVPGRIRALYTPSVREVPGTEGSGPRRRRL